MTIVVTGATGNVGRPLVAELLAAGARVRAISRAAQTGFGSHVDMFDSAVDALAGASAVFLNSRALGPELAPVVAQCGRAGVTKLVALSAINADDDFSRQPSRFRGDRNKEVEQLVVDSGLAWVSLRPTVFATNFAGMWSAQLRAGDVVAGPYAAASTAPIVEADIAAVAAQALLTDEHLGQRIPLTGPQAFTNEELVGVIGDVLGRPLQYREIPADVVRQRFIGLGFTAEFADAYTAMLGETPLNPDGSFSFCYRYFPFFLFNCRTSYFYKVKQLVAGDWTYVYDGSAAHQYFTADQVANLATQTGVQCVRPSPIPTGSVTLEAIGTTYAWDLNSHWNGADGAGNDLTQTGDTLMPIPSVVPDAGLLLDNGAPWTETLYISLNFDEDMKALGAVYYRLSTVQARPRALHQATRWATRGVLPVPPAVRLPTDSTGTGRRVTGSAPRS